MKRFKKVKIYSALEVADLCGVVNQTAINWIKKKYLTAFSTPGGQYRVYEEELALFMKGRGMKLPGELNHYIESPKSVLLIEDDNIFASKLFDEIKSEYTDFVIERAVDAFEAGTKVVLNDFSLVLLNADIIGYNSLDVCRLIRSGGDRRKKTIIVFTENAEEMSRELHLNAGADVYIQKPFDLGQISIYLE